MEKSLIFEKFCPRCIQSKPIRSFYAHISQCRSCYRTIHRGLEKRCSKCKIVKNIERDFSPLKNGKTHCWCKRCACDSALKRYHEPGTREKALARRKAYRIKNRTWILERDRATMFKRKMVVLAHYGHGKIACACCGDDVVEFLTLDHIDADGADHRRALRNKGKGYGTGWFIYKWLLDKGLPPGYQTLCSSCNVGKHRSGVNKCPHQIQREALWQSFIDFATNQLASERGGRSMVHTNHPTYQINGGIEP